MTARFYLRDFAGTGYCPSGIRGWFDRQGIDFRAFVRDGIECQTLIDTGDALVVDIARAKLESTDGEE